MVQLELPFTLDGCGGMDEVYQEQKPYYGYGFFCSLSPNGIKKLDGNFCERIRGFSGDKNEYNSLRRSIMENCHLHTVIKNNLLFNLDQSTSPCRRSVTRGR